MAQQQPIRVQVEKKGGCLSGCGTILAVLLVVGIAIKYWYVSVGLIVLAVAIGAIYVLGQREQKREKARQRPGPRNPWLNEVAVALADHGLTERARNTGKLLGGVPMEGDIGLDGDRFTVFINLFSSHKQAQEAELGLRANPKIRQETSQGRSAIKTVGRVLYVANGRGGVVDELRLNDVIQTVGKIKLSPALEAKSSTPVQPAPAAPAPALPASAANQPTTQAVPSHPDALEQLRKLGELHAAGVLTDEEFEAKKSDLLRRV